MPVYLLDRRRRRVVVARSEEEISLSRRFVTFLKYFCGWFALAVTINVIYGYCYPIIQPYTNYNLLHPVDDHRTRYVCLCVSALCCLWHAEIWWLVAQIVTMVPYGIRRASQTDVISLNDGASDDETTTIKPSAKKPPVVKKAKKSKKELRTHNEACADSATKEPVNFSTRSFSHHGICLKRSKSHSSISEIPSHIFYDPAINPVRLDYIEQNDRQLLYRKLLEDDVISAVVYPKPKSTKKLAMAQSSF